MSDYGVGDVIHGTCECHGDVIEATVLYENDRAPGSFLVRQEVTTLHGAPSSVRHQVRADRVVLMDRPGATHHRG